MSPTTTSQKTDEIIDAWGDDEWILPDELTDFRIDAYDKLFILHPKVDVLARRLLDQMSQTRATIERNTDRNREWGSVGAKPDELTLLPLLGPSGAGKSKTLQFVTSKIHQKRAVRNSIPILVVTLRSTKNVTSDLQASILEAFNDPSHSSVRKRIDYSEFGVNNAIGEIARHKGTTVVVLDEAHNALSSSTPLEVADALRSILNDGVFSIVLSGTEKLTPIFDDAEFKQRCETPVDFSPPRITNIESCFEFFRFSERLCNAMHQEGIVQLPFTPLRKELECASLFEMSEGNIGRVVRIIRRGLKHVFHQGRSSLDWTSVVEAHNSWLSLGTADSVDGRTLSTKPYGLPSHRTVAMVKSMAGSRSNVLKA